MTREEWLEVRVGDEVVDRKLKGAPRRKVLEVQRVTPDRGGSKHPRTTLVVPSLKSRGAVVILWSTEDTLGDGHGGRFELVRAARGR